jgi:hypothetical protein
MNMRGISEYFITVFSGAAAFDDFGDADRSCAAYNP